MAGALLRARASVFLRAADLLAGPWRERLAAATMLGQSKTAYQAEIDTPCELIDFWRFNVAFGRQILADQPISSPGVWNRVEYRPLEGFVYAITPFNFTAIAGNLPTAPALMGNTVIWKASPTQAAAAYLTMQLLEAAGLPAGVINLILGDGPLVSDVALARPAARRDPLHRLDRHLPDAVEAGRRQPVDLPDLPAAGRRDRRQGLRRRAPLRRPGGADHGPDPGRLRLPGPEVLRRIPGLRAAVGVGSDGRGLPDQGRRVDLRRRDRPVQLRRRGDRPEVVRPQRGRDRAGQGDPGLSIAAGGTYDDSVGFFIAPTVLLGDDPTDDAFRTEYFGPILAVHVYDDAEPGAWADILTLVDEGSAYGLTGAVIADDRTAIAEADTALRFAAGNFYINDKPTGAVVGQQPFGGARASGTNDKAGSAQNLLRWVSARTVKETFVPPRNHLYPHQG